MNWTPSFSIFAIKVVASPSQNDKLYIFVSAIDHFCAQTLKSQADPHIMTILQYVYWRTDPNRKQVFRITHPVQMGAFCKCEFSKTPSGYRPHIRAQHLHILP